MLFLSPKTRMLNKLPETLRLLSLHIILLAVILLFLSLQEASPRVVSITEEISPRGSFSVTFNKPFEHDDIEEKLTVWKKGERIAGTLKTTDTTLVFSPVKPWESGQSYQVKIDPLLAERGNVTTELIVQNITIKKEKFLYLSKDDRLMEGDPEMGTVEAITPEEYRILNFSIGTNGHFVAIYGPRDDNYKNGILFGEKKEGRYRLTVLPVVETPRYSRALLCNRDQALLSLSQGNKGEPRLEYHLIDWENPLGQESLQEWNINDIAVYNDADLACSEDTTRVLYRKVSGAFVTNFLGEESEDLIGVFDATSGFSRRDTLMLLQKFITEISQDTIYRSEISLYQPRGESATISEPNTLFREASFNGNGTLLSLLFIDGKSNVPRVETYVQDEQAWIKKETVFSSLGQRIIHQTLSPDGHTLALEVELDEMATKTSADESKIILWNLERGEKLPFEWEGKNVQWEK